MLHRKGGQLYVSVATVPGRARREGDLTRSPDAIVGPLQGHIKSGISDGTNPQ